MLFLSEKYLWFVFWWHLITFFSFFFFIQVFKLLVPRFFPKGREFIARKNIFEAFHGPVLLATHVGWCQLPTLNFTLISHSFVAIMFPPHLPWSPCSPWAAGQCTHKKGCQNVGLGDQTHGWKWWGAPVPRRGRCRRGWKTN